MQASSEQLDSSSAPIYPVANIPAQMCPQFSPDPVNLAVQTVELTNHLHSSPKHFVSCFSCSNNYWIQSLLVLLTDVQGNGAGLS